MSQWSFQSNEVQKNIISSPNNFIFHLPLHSGVAYLTNVTMLSLSAHHPMKSLVLCCPFQSLQSMNVNKEKAWLGRLVKNLPPSEFVIPLTHIHISGKQLFRRIFSKYDFHFFFKNGFLIDSRIMFIQINYFLILKPREMGPKFGINPSYLNQANCRLNSPTTETTKMVSSPISCTDACQNNETS